MDHSRMRRPVPALDWDLKTMMCMLECLCGKEVPMDKSGPVAVDSNGGEFYELEKKNLHISPQGEFFVKIENSSYYIPIEPVSPGMEISIRIDGKNPGPEGCWIVQF